jgi:hypothetical protein
MKPKTPKNRKWQQVGRGLAGDTGALWFRLGAVLVCSQVARMGAPDSSGDVLLTWLVSVSEAGRSMPTDLTMRRVRRAFGMQQAEEDNHENGVSRKLFLVVDPSRRVACECKTDETVVTRPDGYQYSLPEGSIMEDGVQDRTGRRLVFVPSAAIVDSGKNLMGSPAAAGDYVQFGVGPAEKEEG